MSVDADGVGSKSPPGADQSGPVLSEVLAQVALPSVAAPPVPSLPEALTVPGVQFWVIGCSPNIELVEPDRGRLFIRIETVASSIVEPAETAAAMSNFSSARRSSPLLMVAVCPEKRYCPRPFARLPSS